MSGPQNRKPHAQDVHSVPQKTSAAPKRRTCRLGTAPSRRLRRSSQRHNSRSLTWSPTSCSLWSTRPWALTAPTRTPLGSTASRRHTPALLLTLRDKSSQAGTGTRSPGQHRLLRSRTARRCSRPAHLPYRSARGCTWRCLCGVSGSQPRGSSTSRRARGPVPGSLRQCPDSTRVARSRTAPR